MKGKSASNSPVAVAKWVKILWQGVKSQRDFGQPKPVFPVILNVIFQLAFGVGPGHGLGGGFCWGNDVNGPEKSAGFNQTPPEFSLIPN